MAPEQRVFEELRRMLSMSAVRDVMAAHAPSWLESADAAVNAYLDKHTVKGESNATIIASPAQPKPENHFGPLAPGEAEKWEDYKRIRNMPVEPAQPKPIGD